MFKIPALILRSRWPILILLTIFTILVALRIPRLEKSYNYVNALPKNSKAYNDYAFFKKNFPEQGNSIVIGVQKSDFFTLTFLKNYKKLVEKIKQTEGVQSVLSITNSFYLQKNAQKETFIPRLIFDSIPSQKALTEKAKLFQSIPLYQGLLYNADTKAYLLILNIDSLHSFTKKRDKLIQNIDNALTDFKNYTALPHTYISGMPYIRTKISDIISYEMGYLIIASIIFLIIVIGFAFRSLYYILITLCILIFGLIWTFATIEIFGYKITLLNGIVPSLILIIGIPNCIYFFHKYARAYRDTNNRTEAIIIMLKEMGIITLFCNITAALGFFVFFFTKSQLLEQFGLIASINILLLFVFSYLLIPIFLSITPPPKHKKKSVIEHHFFQKLLARLALLIIQKKNTVLLLSLASCIISFTGFYKLSANSHIVDDIPKHNELYDNLYFFEKKFNGIMPLEILINTQKKKGATTDLKFLEKTDMFCREINNTPGLSRPLSIIEALKFTRQMYYNGDSNFYNLPTTFDIQFLAPYLKYKYPSEKSETINRIISNFTDSAKQILRLNFRVADIGHQATETLLNTLKQKLTTHIDTVKNKIIITGGTLAFLEGNKFIMFGLKTSILWAIIFMVGIMFYLFRSVKMVIVSIIPNIIPIALSLGLLGWLHITLKPSLVIIFSITFGITIDITIRILMHYKNFLKDTKNISAAINKTLEETGISVIYTTLTLIGGFCIFMISQFESIRYLGIITTFTLFTATFSNLILLPILLRLSYKSKR